MVSEEGFKRWRDFVPPPSAYSSLGRAHTNSSAKTIDTTPELLCQHIALSVTHGTEGATTQDPVRSASAAAVALWMLLASKGAAGLFPPRWPSLLQRSAPQCIAVIRS